MPIRYTSHTADQRYEFLRTLASMIEKYGECESAVLSFPCFLVEVEALVERARDGDLQCD